MKYLPLSFALLVFGCGPEPSAVPDAGPPRDVPQPKDNPVPQDTPASDVPVMDAPPDAPSLDVPAPDRVVNDAPSAETNTGDAPDAPPAVCGACMTTTATVLCGHAPGCGTSARFCAPNTCGDAVAIPYCGCDGRTFVTGCLFPDRPYLHAGPCEAGDGGTLVSDHTVTDGGTMCMDVDALRRGCMCVGAGMSSPVVACAPSATGACRTYVNGCVESGVIPCTLLAYRDHPGLRERCVAYCASLREREPAAACAIESL